MNRRRILWLLILISAALLLGGCGVPREGVVDWNTAEPDGWWQVLIVFPLAKSLIWLNTSMVNWDIPYSWGFAIILFTVIIKLITFPLTMIQIKSMQAQKSLQPRLQELQKKFGKNKDKMAQEQMKLYREAGVNPLSGCLPMVVQMPVLFGLYSALVALGPSLTDARFFWIPDLGFPEFTRGLAWIPEKFNEGEYLLLLAYLVLPALLMISQVYMQRMTTATTPTGSEGQAGMMKQMTTIMTLMFGFFTLQVPAGLSLYWVTSNLLQLGQTYAANYLSGVNNAIAPAAPQALPATAGVATSDGGSTVAPAAEATEVERRGRLIVGGTDAIEREDKMNEGQSYEYSAKTVEAAVDEGLRQLGVSRDDIEIEVINEGSRGILGIGATDALVRLTRRDAGGESDVQAEDGGEVADEAEVVAETEPEETADIDSVALPSEVSEPGEEEAAPVPAVDTHPGLDEEEEEDDEELEDLAFDLLNQMLVHLGIEAEIEVAWQDNPEDSDRALSLNVVGEDLGFLIGRNGETLASMQYLIRLMVNQELHRWKNIVIDIDGYKQRRAEQLSQLAHRLAEQVVASGRPASLEPMPASERRLVHIALRNHELVYTASTGEDTRRKVQILLR